MVHSPWLGALILGDTFAIADDIVIILSRDLKNNEYRHSGGNLGLIKRIEHTTWTGGFAGPEHSLLIYI